MHLEWLSLSSFFSLDWLGLNWTSWAKLNAGVDERKMIPVSQGVYRVRPLGKDFLVYVGQTNNLKRRTRMLARHSFSKEMPWNDPHTAAPNLWAWRQEEGWDYEVSVASILGLPTQNQEGLECFLLWKYRCERGESTICNHGRFHPDYIKSSDRSKGRRGRKLSEKEERNRSWGSSYPPLKIAGSYDSDNWMGFQWTNFVKLHVNSILPTEPGIYRIADLNTRDLLYIGETSNLKDRLNNHRRRFENGYVSFSFLPKNMPHYQRLEIENDLIGNYYELTKRTPVCQFIRQKRM